MKDYDDNRKIQPKHGKRTYIPGAEEQFDDVAHQDWTEETDEG